MSLQSNLNFALSPASRSSSTAAPSPAGQSRQPSSATPSSGAAAAASSSSSVALPRIALSGASLNSASLVTRRKDKEKDKIVHDNEGGKKTTESDGKKKATISEKDKSPTVSPIAPRVTSLAPVSSLSSRSNTHSIGGSSGVPGLPLARASSKADESKAAKTPRLTLTESRSSRVLSPRTLSHPLPPALQEIQNVNEAFGQFAELYIQQVDLIKRTIATAPDLKEEDAEIAQTMLRNALKDQWLTLRQQMDGLLTPNEQEEIEEESPAISRVNSNSLAMDFTHPNPRASIDKKSLKDKASKHMLYIREFLTDFMLDLTSANPWQNKENMRRMEKLLPSLKKLELKEGSLPPLTIVFTYLQQLILLGEILKQYGSDVDSINENHIFMIPLVEEAQRLLKHLKECKIFKEGTDKERKTKLEASCVQTGDCVIQYAQALAKHLCNHLQQIAPSIKNYELFRPALFDQLARDILQRQHAVCPGFAADFERATKGKWLSLVSNKADIQIPKMSKEIRQSNDSYQQYCHDFVLFLMQNLGIDPSKDPIAFDLLETLKSSKPKDEEDKAVDESKKLKEKEPIKNTKSMAQIYQDLEGEWNRVKAASPSARMEGVFKLLPLLRIFNQNNLLSIHKAMGMLQQGLESQYVLLDLRGPAKGSELQEIKITAQHPSAAFRKELEAGQVLDRRTKGIEIAFKDDKVTISYKRLAFLAHSKAASERNSIKHLYLDCPIWSTFAIEASIHDLDAWTVTTHVDIERPDNVDSTFLYRYSLMIALLETMGISYQVTNK